MLGEVLGTAAIISTLTVRRRTGDKTQLSKVVLADLGCRDAAAQASVALLEGILAGSASKAHSAITGSNDPLAAIFEDIATTRKGHIRMVLDLPEDSGTCAKGVRLVWVGLARLERLRLISL